MIHRDYRSAQLLFRQMLRSDALVELDSQQYSHLVVRCAKAEQSCGDYDAARALLESLDFTALPISERREAVLMLARAYNEQGEIERSFNLLKKLERYIPRGNWRREERAFYSSLALAIDERYDRLLSRAEEAMDSLSYDSAIPLYETVLEMAQKGVYPARGGEEDPATFEAKLRYRLGEAHYHLGEYDEVYTFLSPIRSGSLKNQGLSPYYTEVCGHCLHLLGLAQKRQGKQMEALATFLSYLDTVDGRSGERAMVEWEAALCYLQLGRTEQARSIFARITGGSQALTHLAQVYLSRIDLETSDFASVEERLILLADHLHPDDPLQYEVAYLRGEGALQREDFKQAITLFERAVPRKQAAWYSDALHGLGWAYIGLAGQMSHDPASALIVFTHGVEAFAKVEGPRGDLATARAYLEQHELIGERVVRQRVRELLADSDRFAQREDQAEALLLLAEVTPSYSDREALYAELTLPRFAETTVYGTGWFKRGLNRFEQGEAYRQLGDPSCRDHYLAACEALSRARHHLHGKESARALVAHAQATFHAGEKEGAYQTLASLFGSHQNLWPLVPAKDEVLYLLGLMGAAADLEAESYLEHVLAEYPDGDFAAPSLNVLATLYFQRTDYEKAERLFTRLATQHPQSRLAGNALFWAAESAEWQRKDPELIRSFRRKVIDHYPDSEFADQAYFEFYSFAEYMQGDYDALEHLQAMPDHFADSPYLVIAHYLQGLNFRDFPDEAIEAFTAGVEAFDRAYARGKIPLSNLEYFTNVRYRTLVELALSNLERGKGAQGAERHVSLKAATEVFEGIIADFSDPTHLLSRLVGRQESYPRLLEEAEFGLAQSYLAAHNHEAAELALSAMLEKYEALQQTQGYYPSRVWYHQGRLCMERGQPELALECLRHAEEAASHGLLTSNQRLDLWVQQSGCLQELGELDDAMRLLSKVINDEAASPLRIEAMYRRSEIYELQGRHDLALKQLQATANKTGLWAAKAQEQLRDVYGF